MFVLKEWWEECNDPCYYGNGFIPCGSVSGHRGVAGVIRNVGDRPIEADCTVGY